MNLNQRLAMVFLKENEVGFFNFVLRFVKAERKRAVEEYKKQRGIK